MSGRSGPELFDFDTNWDSLYFTDYSLRRFNVGTNWTRRGRLTWSNDSLIVSSLYMNL